MAFKVTSARKQHVARLLRRQWPKLVAEVSPDARLLYTVGALVANSAGYIPNDRLNKATRDPELVRVANELMAITAARAGDA